MKLLAKKERNNDMDNQQSLNELALFAGAGGGILAGKLLGWNTVCAVEWEPYPASVLCARQNEEILSPFPIWDDVQTFDGKPWRGIVDVISGGFPCQDISAAGKGVGITGERSSMWKHMARIIGEIQPTYVFAENSSMLTKRGLEVVLEDLASMGYDAEWGVLSAAEVGANHRRKRIWIVGKMANANRNGFNKSFRNVRSMDGTEQEKQTKESKSWETQKSLRCVVHWPTPRTRGLIGNSGSKQLMQARLDDGTTSVAEASAMSGLKMFPTPQASDNRDRGNMSNPSIQRRVAIGKQIMLSQSVDPSSGQLNPTWVEWLMGWPLGWTDLKPLEMDKSLYVQQQHGLC
jgi:DNA (cytosine-5)-methyltransferase 1